MKRIFKIGTRSSPLAVRQAKHVADALGSAAGVLGLDCGFELVPTRSTGDKIQNVALADLGGKGLFAKEIESALLDGHIDLGVHSFKDMETVLPAGLVIAAVTEREDPRDVLISRCAASIRDLPAGARLGTASARRRAQALAVRPDLKVSLIRGNVGTRLQKIENGEFDATLLAAAGLIRLGIFDRLTREGLCHVQSTGEILPPVAQGIVAVEARADGLEANPDLMALMKAVNHSAARFASRMEREVLRALDGSCKSSIGVHCFITDGAYRLRSVVYSPDGRQAFSREIRGAMPSGQISYGEMPQVEPEVRKAHAMGLKLATDAQHVLSV